MTNTIQAHQITNAAGTDLETVLAAVAITGGSGSVTFPDGTILKWGTTGAYVGLGANSITTKSIVFAVAFPTSCDFFHAILTPATSTDFYGVTTLVSRTTTGASFTLRNGATAQNISSGVWFALGR